MCIRDRTLTPGDGDYEAILALARARLPQRRRPLGGVDGRAGVAERDFWTTCQASQTTVVILRYEPARLFGGEGFIPRLDPATGRIPPEARFSADSLVLPLQDVPNAAYADAYAADNAYYLLGGEVVFSDFGHLADPGNLAAAAQALLG